MKFLILALFLISGCAGIKPVSNSIESVNIENDFHSPVLNTEKIENDVYGPMANSSSPITVEKNNSQRYILALDLSPALYQALAYAKLFTNLERKNIKVNIITSSGFSAIIAVIYAKYQSSSRLDWKLYALMRELGDGNIVFTSSWYRKIENFLKNEFNETRLEELKTLVAIPIFENGKYRLVHSGNIVSVLMESIKLQDSKNSFLLTPSPEYFGLEKEFGTDGIFRITAMPRRIRLKTISGFVLGVYSKLAGFIHYQTNEFQVLQEEENIFIDNNPNISDLMSSVSESSKKISEEISVSIEEWTNKNR